MLDSLAAPAGDPEEDWARLIEVEAQLAVDDPAPLQLNFELQRGLLLGRRGENAEAIESLTAILGDMLPRDHEQIYAEALLQRAICYLNLGSPKLAAKDASTALAYAVSGVEPKWEVRAHWVLGLLALDQGAIDSAIQALSLGLALAIEHDAVDERWMITRTLGELFIDYDLPEDALRLYQATLEEFGDSLHEDQKFSFRAGRAAAHIELGDSTRGLAELQELFDRALPDLPQRQLTRAKMWHARACWLEGKIATATTLLGHLKLELRPSSEDWQKLQRLNAELAAASGQLELAAEQLQVLLAASRVLDDEREQHAILVALSEVHADLGQERLAYDALLQLRQLEHTIHARRLPEVGSMDVALKTQVELHAEKEKRRIAEQGRRDSDDQVRRTRSLLIAILINAALIAFMVWLSRIARMRERKADVERSAAEKLRERERGLRQGLELELKTHKEAFELEHGHRQELEQALGHKRRLEALGRLTGGISHDFNNMLAVMSQSHELIHDRLIELADEEGLELLDRAQQAGEASRDLTSRLLAFGAQQRLRPRPVELVPYLQRVACLLRGCLGDDVRFITVEPQSSAVISVDESSLTAALMNLTGNAGKAITPPGTVRLVATEVEVEVENAELLGLVHGGSYVRLDVIDTGRGMTAEQLACACEPFYTSGNAEEGHGLGLSIVHGFAQQSGGALRLTSRSGVGTTASLYLPLDPALRAQGAEAAGGLVTPARSIAGTRILLVEDDVLVRDVTRRMLTRLGCEVECCADGESARTKLLDEGRPDVVISDVRMPGVLSGPELADWLAETFPAVGLLLITGNANAFHQPYQVLRKPFRGEQLSMAILEQLDKRARPELADTREAQTQ